MSSNILDFWHKIEHFNPHPIDKIKEKERFLGKLPWQDSSAETKYKIFLGVFQVNQAMKEIRQIFNDKEPVEESNEFTYYAEILVDKEGKFISDSLKLSTMPWSLGQLYKNKLYAPEWQKEFNYYYHNVHAMVNETIKKNCTIDELNLTVKKLSELSGWKPSEFYDPAILFQKSKSSSEEQQDQILCSFFIKELELVKEKIVHTGKAFNQYIGIEKMSDHQHDVFDKDNIEMLIQASSPNMLPYGRWPSEYPLYLMQQIAVNKTLENTQGVFSVNGPPGTGKTTLLRDIVAAVITKRAEIMVKYDNPNHAFTEINKANINNYIYNVYKLNDDLTDYSIVVASSNNKAVENITKELPLKDAISNKYNPDYFKEVAQNTIGQDAWGMLAAVLGKAQNCSKFISEFWFNSNTNMGMHLTNNDTTLGDWDKARNSYKKASQKVQALLKMQESWYTAVMNYRTAQKKQKRKQKELRNLRDTELHAKDKLSEVKEQIREAKTRVEERRQELQRLKNTKPWFLAMLFNTSRAKKYNQDIKKYGVRFDNAVYEYAMIEKGHDNQERKLNHCRGAVIKAQQELAKAEEKVKLYSCAIRDAQMVLGENLPNNDYWSKPLTELHKCSPWITEELNNARAELFIEALDLHKTFIEVASECTRSALRVFIDLLEGHKSQHQDYVKQLWDVFFLVVPVVSTTFSSLGRMLNGMGSESIAHLLVDEAGQAVPHAAAGGIWRARRVVVVGDPLQIEPIQKVPVSVIKSVGRHYRVPDLLTDETISVQILADRANDFGAYISAKDESRWVGCPLRVHRRCQQLMFQISNRIAYNEQMVQATPDSDCKSTITESCWIYVEGESSSSQWVPNQGMALIRVLQKAIMYALQTQKKLPNIYIISPYKAVAKKARKLLSEKLNDWCFNYSVSKDDIQDWLNNNIGTIHTFQGKEADIVILCLGVDKKNIRSAEWAASSPNILNVAVTRARHRLVVIGDIILWGELRYFKLLKQWLFVYKKDGDQYLLFDMRE